MPRFSETLREHARYPSNRGVIEDADFIGRASLNGGPPYISIYLRVKNSVIENAGFVADGCGVTTAVCSALTELLEKKRVNCCREIGESEICKALDGLPPDKMYCAKMVLQALNNALADWPEAEPKKDLQQE